jgi:TRAP-type C4-dicarboxylate transport system permease small subunit
MNSLDVFQKLDNKVERFATAIATFSFAATVFMMFFISADVAMRKFLSASINGSYEIVEVSMAMCVFAAFAYTQVKHGHVHVTMLIIHFPPKIRMLIYALTSLISTFIIGVVAYASAKQSVLSSGMSQVTGVLKIPYSALYGIESFFMWVFFIVLLYDTVKNIVAIFYDPLAKEIQSSWS